MKKLFFIFVLLFFSGLFSFAQEDEDKGAPIIISYPPKVYQHVSVSSQNWCFLEDKRGFLYIGNTEGLLEFDGTSWKIIKTSNNSLVLSMDIDKDGTIFIGGSGELGYVNASKKGTLEYISLKSKIPQKYQNFNDIRLVKCTKEGVYFHTRTHTFRYFEGKIYLSESKPGFNANRAHNEIFFSSRRENGLYIVRNDKWQLLPHTHTFSARIVMEYTDNSILILTNQGDLLTYELSFIKPGIFDISKLTPPESIIKKLNNSAVDFLRQNQLYSACKVNNKSFAFGTLRNGIAIINEKGEITQKINKQTGLPSNTIIALYTDKYDNLWVGLDKGIARVEINSPLSLFNENYGLSSSPYSFIKHNNHLYIGTAIELLYTKGGLNLNNKLKPVENGIFTTMSLSKFENNLLAFANFGIYQIKDSTAKNIESTYSIYCSGTSKKFPNHIFLGLTDGLSVVELNTSEDGQDVEIINKFRYQDISNPIRKIASDNNGDLWLTTTFAGIYHLKFQGKDLFRYNTAKYDTAHGLPQLDYNMVNWINNRLVVATRKGIYTAAREGGINKKTIFVKDNSFGTFFNDNNFPVTQILIDQYDQTWIFCDKQGFGQIISRDGIPYWNSSPFMKIPLAGTFSFNLTLEGNIWILCSDEIYKYDPKIDKDYKSKFDTHIRKVSLHNDSVIFNGNYFVNKNGKNKIITHQPENFVPTIKYVDNDISFDFATPFFESEKEIEYQYKLEGFDNKWSIWSLQNTKEYTNLREGNYKFKLRARNIFNHISNETAYSFVILPPIYRTLYAYIAYGIGIALVILLIIFFNSKRLKYLNARLEKTINERTAELKTRNQKILEINNELNVQKEEFKKQAKLMHESNIELEKLSLVARETDNAILIMDDKGNFEWVNESYTRMFGYTLEELIKEISTNIIGENTPEYIRDLVNRCMYQKETVSYEFATMSRAGKSMWVQCTLSPIVDEKGNLSKIIAVDSDITRIKNVEQQILKKNEEIIEQRDLFKRQKQRAEKAWHDMQKLSDFGQQITAINDIKELHFIIFDYITDLMDTTSFGIGIYNEEKSRLEFNNFIDKGDSVPFFTNEMSQTDSFSVWSLKNRKHIFINDLQKEYKNYIPKTNFETVEQPSSIILVPLSVDIFPLGVLTVQSYQTNAYTENDLTILTTIASYVSFAIEKHTLRKRLKRKHIKIKEGTEFALKAQNFIIKDTSELDKAFDNFIVHKPKEIVGGDFYWYHKLPSDDMLTKMVIATVDCTGHGLSGTLMVSIVENLINQIVCLKKIFEPQKILSQLDVFFRKALNQTSKKDKDFVEISLCYLEQTLENNIKVIFAGARRPLFYYIKSISQIQTLEGDRKHIGGISTKKDVEFTQQEILLMPGDIIYLMTDGLGKQIGSGGKKFSNRKIITMLEKSGHLPLIDQKSTIENSFDYFRQNEVQLDDITVVGIRL